MKALAIPAAGQPPAEARSAPAVRQAMPRARGALAISAAAGLLQTAAALLWLPQAGLIALAVQGIAAGATAQAALAPAAGVLALGLLRTGLDMMATRRAFREARAILSALRDKAATALAARSPLDGARPAAGLAASAMAEQAEAVLPYLARFRPIRLRATILPLAILAAILPFSWLAALVLLATAPLIPIFMALIGLRAQEASEAQMLELGGMNGFLLDRLRGLATIRALDAVDATARRLRAAADALRRRSMAVLRIAFLSSAVLEFFAALGVAMVAVHIGFHLLGQFPIGTWGHRLDLGEALFVLLLAPAFFEPLRDMAAAWHDRAAGEAALTALDRLAAPGLPLPGALAAASPAAAPPGPPGVTIEGLGFRHAGAAAPVLTGLDLAIAPGERVALLGPSGAGKSTLLALIAGLAPTTEGRITIGGVALTAASAPALRARIGWIGQRPHLFAGSLRANIALGRAGIGGAEVTAAAAAAAFAILLGDEGRGPVGEGGAGLSGGEALRLALSRAIADPRAELILADEPTAHLDAATAAAVTDGLLALAAGRTLIVATHDLVLVARLDRVVAVPS
ncbi:MAG TPA: thiol reductant ABC exporter subunit CydD [Roseomonas sp.]|jgi:ATP-binding cassette subfamily C protein CydD